MTLDDLKEGLGITGIEKKLDDVIDTQVKIAEILRKLVDDGDPAEISEDVPQPKEPQIEGDAAEETTPEEPKKKTRRGRPKGSKNKKAEEETPREIPQ